jgi:O-antigen/teichoic acid export membrane protein
VGSDRRVLLSGTMQNVIGIGFAGIALIVIQVLTSRRLGPAGFGAVTVLTQAAFVASFATRAGMDMAMLRDVAIDMGAGRTNKVRAAVVRAVGLAALVSSAIAVVVAGFEGTVAELFSLSSAAGRWAVPAAAVGLPAIAVTNVWLAATRGLKIMRYTLYIFWAGQNLAWIAFSLLFWEVSVTPTASILAYSASWFAAAGAAGVAWWREARHLAVDPPDPGWVERLFRFVGPRAPAALFAQLLFWTDLFVVTNYVSDPEVGVYSAVLRAGQILVLFLASVNMIFAPFVADLHARGERDRLDELFKTLTRWIVVATLPLVWVIVIAPDSVLGLFGREFEGAETALLIVLIGQFINAATGSGGLVLVMIGRTGYDLAVYMGSLTLSLALAFTLSPRFGITGAAIANAVTFVASNAARLALVKRFARIQPYDLRYLRAVLPTIAGALVTWMVHASTGLLPVWDILVSGGTGLTIYAATYAVVGLTTEERRALRRLLGLS